MNDSVEYFGVTVKGPAHVKQGLANQDAWIGRIGAYGTLVVVCDGVGSRRYSNQGAKMACLAAVDAVRDWSRAADAPTQYLAHLIEVLWRIRISPLEPNDCATTCLLALRRSCGKWVIGGIGDGIVVTQTGPDDLCWVIGNTRPCFSNVVDAMGFGPTVKLWRFATFSEEPRGRVALLGTDGISDDLISEKTSEFVSWLLSTYTKGSKRQQLARLRKELGAWPTGRHADDKTLAVLFDNGHCKP